MGVLVSKIWGGKHKYEADSTTGLSSEDKAALAGSFNDLKQDMSKSGERLFLIYFEEFPENKKYFRDFKNKPIEELAGNSKLIAHATNVMCAINGIILHLNNPDALVETVKKIGYNHGKRNIPMQAFVDLKAAFAKLLQETLKGHCTNDIIDVWMKTLDIIAKVFMLGVEEYKNEKQNEI